MSDEAQLDISYGYKTKLYVLQLVVPYWRGLKLNTIQLVPPGGNHCCLMANDVQNSRLFIHLLILRTVYEHDKQKTIVYKSDQFKMEESK